MNIRTKLLVTSTAILLVGGGAATAGAVVGHAASTDRPHSSQDVQQHRGAVDDAGRPTGSGDGTVTSPDGAGAGASSGAISADQLGPDDTIVDHGFAQGSDGSGVTGAPGTDGSAAAPAH